MSSDITFHGKYIITNNTPILFAYNTRHSDMAKKAKSAGFFYLIKKPESFYGFDVVCYGESESLEVKSNPIVDSKLIMELLVGEFTHVVLNKFYDEAKFKSFRLNSKPD